MTTTCRSDLDPPACCEPLTDKEWAARTARLAAARSAAYRLQPAYCPRCGSDDIAPSFVGPTWECTDCPNVWSVGR